MITRSCVEVTGTLASAELLFVFDSAPLAPSSLMLTVFVIAVVPEGKELATRTTNDVVLLLFAASEPVLNWHKSPAFAPTKQFHTLVPTNVVLVGTYSVSKTLFTSMLPVLV